MTRNAAMLLGELLTSYEVPPHETPQHARGIDGVDDLSGWREHAEAIDLVRRVDEHIQALQDEGQAVMVFAKSLPHWYAGAAFATTPWGTTIERTREACAESHLDMLAALGMLIDNREHLTISAEDERSLSDVLDEAKAMVDTDETLPREVKSHLVQLLRTAKFYLDHLDKYGPEAVRDVALQLGGALYTRAEGEADPEKKSRFKAMAWMLVGGFMGTGGSEGAKLLGHATKAGIEAIGG